MASAGDRGILKSVNGKLVAFPTAGGSAGSRGLLSPAGRTVISCSAATAGDRGLLTVQNGKMIVTKSTRTGYQYQLKFSLPAAVGPAWGGKYLFLTHRNDNTNIEEIRQYESPAFDQKTLSVEGDAGYTLYGISVGGTTFGTAEAYFPFFHLYKWDGNFAFNSLTNPNSLTGVYWTESLLGGWSPDGNYLVLDDYSNPPYTILRTLVLKTGSTFTEVTDSTEKTAAMNETERANRVFSYWDAQGNTIYLISPTGFYRLRGVNPATYSSSGGRQTFYLDYNAAGASYWTDPLTAGVDYNATAASGIIITMLVDHTSDISVGDYVKIIWSNRSGGATNLMTLGKVASITSTEMDVYDINEHLVYGGTISKIYIGDESSATWTNITNPRTHPADSLPKYYLNTLCPADIAICPKGDAKYILLLLGGNDTEGYPYFTLYKKTTTSITALSSLSAAREVSSAAWSPAGTHLALGERGFIEVFVNDDDDTFPRAYNKSLVSGSGTAKAVGWSPDGKYLAIGLNVSPYILIYKNAETTSPTLLSNPATLPTATVYGMAFSPNGHALAVLSSSELTIYSRDGDTFTALTGEPDTNVSGYAGRIAFSPDNKWLAVCLGSDVSPGNDAGLTKVYRTPF